MKLRLNNKIYHLIDLRMILFLLYNLAYVFYMCEYIPRIINLTLLVIFNVVNIIKYIGKYDVTIGKKNVFYYETKNVFIAITTIWIISTIIQLINLDVEMYLYSSLMYLVLPVVTAYLWANTTNDDERIYYFYILLLKNIIHFLLLFYSTLSMSTIRSISWNNSFSSAFESSMAHDFLFLTVIFMYYNKKAFAIISAALCMLSFKRLSFILVIAVIVFYRFIPKNRIVGKRLLNITKVCFCVAPLFILYMLSDSGQSEFYNLFGITLDEFTSGRVQIINMVLDNIKTFNGFGTTIAFFQNSASPWLNQLGGMHCDLLRLYLEVTLVGEVIFINLYFNAAKKSFIVYFMMLYLFLELLTSHMLQNLSVWVIFFMFAATISEKSVSYQRERS
jgi:hypothetical protein